MLPTPQEILSWTPYYKFAGKNSTDESRFYSRGRNRGGI